MQIKSSRPRLHHAQASINYCARCAVFVRETVLELRHAARTDRRPLDSCYYIAFGLIRLSNVTCSVGLCFTLRIAGRITLRRLVSRISMTYPCHPGRQHRSACMQTACTACTAALDLGVTAIMVRSPARCFGDSHDSQGCLSMDRCTAQIRCQRLPYVV